MSLLLTFRGPSGQVYGRIFEEVVGGGQDAHMQAATPGCLLNCLRTASLHVCLRPRCPIAFLTESCQPPTMSQEAGWES